MAKHLKPDNVQYIVNLIRDWRGEKITWEAICLEVNSVFSSTTTRQTLFSHKAIREAFIARKKGLKTGATLPVPSSLAYAAKRIARLQVEISELNMQNTALKELFVVWQYNAYKRGLKESDLHEPLPQINRERTDGETR
jgi:hypothetical protein